jgi:hypothetical protein
MYKAMCTCQARGPRATLVDFGNGVQVGLVGMEEAFERFRVEGREPSPTLGDELLAAIRERNYVSRTKQVEEQYRAVRTFFWATWLPVSSLTRPAR